MAALSDDRASSQGASCPPSRLLQRQHTVLQESHLIDEPFRVCPSTTCNYVLLQNMAGVRWRHGATHLVQAVLDRFCFALSISSFSPSIFLSLAFFHVVPSVLVLFTPLKFSQSPHLLFPPALLIFSFLAMPLLRCIFLPAFKVCGMSLFGYTL